jgi:hypothetical protein
VDDVLQVLYRTTCLDGFGIGVEVGRRLAARDAAKKKAEEQASGSDELASCNIKVT